MSREKNANADALATLAAWFQLLVPGTIRIQVSEQDNPAHCMRVTLEPSQDELAWFFISRLILKIKLSQKEQPPQTDGPLYGWLRNSLHCSGQQYKRSYNQMLLRCLDKREADEVMQEIHAGVCGPHTNGILLAKKIMHQGYY